MTAKHRSHAWKMIQLNIDGMHCANCEVLIERRFKKIAGVRRVKVSHVTGRAEINCTDAHSSHAVDVAAFER